MELDIIKKLNNISENDFINFDNDIKILEKNIGVKFPKVLFDFYKKIGIHSNLFKSVLNGLEINNYGILELHIDEQTGEKWGLNINNNCNLLFKSDKGKWTNVKYSVNDFLFNEILKTSCFSQKYSAMGKCSIEDIKIATNNGFLHRIKIEPIDLEIANIHDLKMYFYQSCPNDIIAVGRDNIYFGANNKSDFESFISSFGKNWHAPWLGL
ncbi:hypothetical protein [Seonamhaeicola marinus]|uniref:Uncharacterized protein n=1 Tax=Seonamhaeicola marinus TaxID=1912246 RepID=A0A5D0HET9_9FLAO|nr:hypothetical protein [Seonamhaeicola marinus]TYA69806.1 hypothetical protein FUA24_21155 [Seonamhaeicola marinus]